MDRHVAPRPWFAQRGVRHGVRPCAPEGWGAVAAYLIVLVAVAVTIGQMGAGGDVAYRFGYLLGGLIIMAVATAVFVTIVRRKTARDEGDGVGQ